MLFNTLLFVLFAAIAYFHYTQGLFSAAISAILCIFAAMLAVGYHEVVAAYLLKIPDDADAVAILGIFLLSYLISRLLFDNMVPGNVRFPVLMDKIGSGLCGLVAGIFGTGILAIAAQSMPFAPDIGGYSRQTLAGPRSVVVQSNNKATDSIISEQVVGDSLGDPAQLQHLWLHQDDMVLGLARQLSDTGGSLSNGVPLAASHPDYVTELFGERLGAPDGTRHLLVNPDKGAGIKASIAYLLSKAPPSMDGENHATRGDFQTPDIQPDAVLAVVRVNFSNAPGILDPSDSIIRLSPAGVRLEAGENDYNPIGTMVGATLLLKNRMDDSLLLEVGKTARTVDFLFQINPDDLNILTDKGVKTTRFKPGTFLAIERYAVSDLSAMELRTDPPDTQIESFSGSDAGESLGGVMRKGEVLTAALKTFNTTLSPAAQRSSPNNPPGAPANGGRKSNDLLPDLPNHLLGL
jgi:hypothetical protein